MKVKNYTKINYKNLKELCERPDGNIYFRRKGGKTFEVAEGFSYQEHYNSLSSGQFEQIWIKGPSLGTEVEVEE